MRIARLRVRVFAFSGVAVFAALATTMACSDDTEADVPTPAADAAPIEGVPGPCVVTPTAEPACEAGAVFLPDASAPDDASLLDGDTPPSENRCLVVSDRTVTCPSTLGNAWIGEGAKDAIELVVSQRRIASEGDDQRADEHRTVFFEDRSYLQHLHVPASGDATITVDPIPPSPPSTRGLALHRGPRGPYAVLLTSDGDAGSSSTLTTAPLVPGAWTLGPGFPVSAPAWSFPLTGIAGGEGFLVARRVVVGGLPESPRRAEVLPGESLVRMRAGPGGVPAALVRSDHQIRLVEGASLEAERWADQIDVDESGAGSDFAYVATTTFTTGEPLVAPIVRHRASITVARDRSNRIVLGTGYSTCPPSGWLDCDSCPVGITCERSAETYRETAFVENAGRLFIVGVGNESRSAYRYETNQVVGPLCTCTSRSIGKVSSTADTLVVVEVVTPPGKLKSLEVVERMRVTIGPPDSVKLVRVLPRGDGIADVLLGPALEESSLASVRSRTGPEPLRLLRIDTTF
ncbi:MAG: hypothetical protein KIT84_13105 [Labilithrix sp.]|nr:hypothetical protein [Labilithrix sp.]MCW5811954.1 hypothetical protein [Labilithrix sp.]